MDDTFTSLELYQQAGTVPSRSLLDDLYETINTVINRDIALVQVETHRLTTVVLSDKFRKAFMRKNRAWSQEELCKAYEAYVNKHIMDLHTKKEETIEALLGLADHRKEAAREWIEEKEPSQGHNSHNAHCSQ